MCICPLNLPTSLFWVASESSLNMASQQPQDKWLIMELIWFHINVPFFFAKGEGNSCSHHLHMRLVEENFPGHLKYPEVISRNFIHLFFIVLGFFESGCVETFACLVSAFCSIQIMSCQAKLFS